MGKVSWCRVNGITEDVQEIESAKEVVAILMNDVWKKAVIEFGYGSSRNLLKRRALLLRNFFSFSDWRSKTEEAPGGWDVDFSPPA